MITLPIKPLSTNKLWRVRGMMYKSKEYKQYKEDLLKLLPQQTIPEGNLSVTFIFGVSHRGQDIDNFLKGIIDIMQHAYDFNDNRIYHLDVTKQIVKKGDEFISFTINLV